MSTNEQADDGHAAVIIQRRIGWSDTDASGHYHYTAAFRLFEAAESVLMGQLGLLHTAQARIPRVHAEADFRRPLHSHDLVDVHGRVEAVGRSSVTFAFEVHREGELCATGRVIAALMTRPEGDTTGWSDEERRLLLGAGMQRGERLIEG